MGYVIDAWLEQGEPRLRILDADTGIVRMRWAYRREPQRICSGHPPLNCACGAHANLHTLFKSLFLLACADRLSLAESLKSTGLSNVCVRCAGCSEEDELTLNLTDRLR